MAITLNTKVYNWGQFDQSGASRYLETSGSLPSSYSNLTAKVTVSTGKSQRVKWRLAIPVVATVDSGCGCIGEVLRTSYIDVVADLPSTSSLAERQDARLRLAGLVSTTQFIAAWDTFVAPTT